MYTRWLRDGSSFDLGRMTLRELWRAYLTHPAVHLYAAVASLCVALAAIHPPGLARGAAAVAAGLAITCIYEFSHCIQHLNVKPRSRLPRRMKELHLLHHFHDEVGNYGITSFVADRMLGTYYGGAPDRARSPTVFNLGYTVDQARRYPWVATLSGGPPRDRLAPRRAAHPGQPA